jgi:hypothetical protein
MKIIYGLRRNTGTLFTIYSIWLFINVVAGLTHVFFDSKLFSFISISNTDIITFLATLFAGWFALWRFYTSRLAEFKDQFNHVVTTYNTKFITIDSPSLLKSYIDFCSEEHMWYYKGYIPREVYKVWRTRMATKLIGVKKAHPEYYEEVEQFVLNKCSIESQNYYYFDFEDVIKEIFKETNKVSQEFDLETA